MSEATSETTLRLVRVFRYRLYPTRLQEQTLLRTLETLRELYNAALQERRDAWRLQGVSVPLAAQSRELREAKSARPDVGQIHTHLLQDALARVDLSFRRFFARAKANKSPIVGGKQRAGYPRFKGKGRYRTFTFKDAVNHNGVRLMAGGKRVRLTFIGNVKVRLHRPVEGRIKQASVTRSGDGHWYIAFVCDNVPAKLLPATGKTVGVDVGVTAFAALSDGTIVPNPRPFQTAQRDLAAAHRRVARRKRGSSRRRKAVVLLAKQYDKVTRVRRDFHHKVASRLVREFDSISVEKLNIKGLAKSRLSKQVRDAAWGNFMAILADKAESAGREVIAVDPWGTSQDCSGCGMKVPKPLSVRVHECLFCGTVMDRDVNAAINIQARGHRARGGPSCRQPDDPRTFTAAELANGEE